MGQSREADAELQRGHPISVEVPFMLWGNRQVLTRQQMENESWIKEFVNRFPRCFEWHPLVDIVVFYPDGDAPVDRPVTTNLS
jgi:hypothetical protein